MCKDILSNENKILCLERQDFEISRGNLGKM